jgi:hypothetical protein
MVGGGRGRGRARGGLRWRCGRKRRNEIRTRIQNRRIRTR